MSSEHTPRCKLKIFVKEAGLFVLQIPKQIDPFFKMFFFHLGNKKQDGSAFYLVMRYDNITVAIWRIFNYCYEIQKVYELLFLFSLIWNYINFHTQSKVLKKSWINFLIISVYHNQHCHQVTRNLTGMHKINLALTGTHKIHLAR